MCGIAGQVSVDRADARLVARMTRALAHRGPDGERLHVEPQCALGHRRLSLIDLTGGSQPMPNEDGTVHVVSNSEIYNYVELTRELEGRGHVFATASDTEVIVHLYEELGTACVDRLVGMFAFALWDSRRRTLLLARDRFGIKPLYYAEDGDGGLTFASELKALLEDPRLPRALDLAALHDYFRHLTIPEPRTALAAIRKLPAAHVLTWTDGRSTERAYWDITRCGDPHQHSDDAADEAIAAALEDSVKISLRSDAPVGVFLSGGIDSSLLTCLAARDRATPLHTFSVAFAEKPFDERQFSRLVAGHFETTHHEIEVTQAQAADALLRLTTSLDEPFADSSCIPTYLLSVHARQHVKAVLTGEGADELFGGSPWHDASPASLTSTSELLHPAIKLIYRTEDLNAVYSADLRAAVAAARPPDTTRLDDQLTRCPDNLHRHLCADLHAYLPSDLLMKTDRMTMLASLEARVPFLNHPFAEAAWRTASRHKVRDGVRKLVLKRIGRTRLPAEIAERPKKGFSIPMDVWLWTPGPFRDLVFDTLLDSRTRARGQWNTAAVRSMIDDHDHLRQFHGYRLWTLFVFETWQRTFLDAGVMA